MNKQIWYGKRSFRFYYYRYKDSPYYSLSLIGVVISVSIFLIFHYVIPQMNNWFSIRNEVIETQRKIAILKDNINTMNNIDKQLLATNLHIASSALPSSKDFHAIITVLSDSALRSGVGLDDYSFQIGDIASSSGKILPHSPKGLPNIAMTLSVKGTIEKKKLFFEEIQKKLPLSEITSIEGNDRVTTMNVQFYYKPFPTIVFRDEEPIKTISSSRLELLQQLNSWQSASGVENTVSSDYPTSPIPLF